MYVRNIKLTSCLLHENCIYFATLSQKLMDLLNQVNETWYSGELQIYVEIKDDYKYCERVLLINLCNCSHHLYSPRILPDGLCVLNYIHSYGEQPLTAGLSYNTVVVKNICNNFCINMNQLCNYSL
jgi:hypothetical protein